MPRNLDASARRNVVRLGETVTVRNYEYTRQASDQDKYGDGDDQERADSPYTRVPAVFRTNSQQDTNRDEGGHRFSHEKTIYLPDDHAAVTNLAGGPDNAPASEIERSNGEVYRVLVATSQANGLIQATAEVVE